MPNNDHKLSIDVEFISLCAECGKAIPVKHRATTSWKQGITLEIDVQPHTCTVYCDNCGEEMTEGHVCEPEHHPLGCICRDCEDERGDYEYHARKDDSFCEPT
jgi:hypothetical protein